MQADSDKLREKLKAIKEEQLQLKELERRVWKEEQLKELKEDSDDWVERVWKCVGALQKVVNEIAEECRSIYIGRTNCPERRLMEHCKKKKNSQMILLHWTPDWSEVMAMEECLIELTTKFEQSENKSGDSMGEIYGTWQCLYLRVQWKHDADQSRLRISKAKSIDSLSPDTLSTPFPSKLSVLPRLKLKKNTDVDEQLLRDKIRKAASRTAISKTRRLKDINLKNLEKLILESPSRAGAADSSAAPAASGGGEGGLGAMRSVRSIATELASAAPARPGAEDLDMRRALEESQGRSSVAEDRDLAHGLAESMETGAAPSDNTAFASPLPMPLALPWTERAARLVSEPRRSRSSANDLQPSLGRMVEGGSETDATQHLPNRASER